MPENRVGAVQMPRRRQRDEKLAAISVWTCVRHAQHTSSRVRELGDDFVAESAVAAVDGGAAAAGARGVAGLDHEAADDAVAGDGVVEACGGEGGEVVAGLVGGVSFWSLGDWSGDGGLRLPLESVDGKG